MLIPILAGLITAILLVYILFDGWADFSGSLKELLSPKIKDLWQYIVGVEWNHPHDYWGEFKIFIICLISLLVMVLTYFKFN